MRWLLLVLTLLIIIPTGCNLVYDGRNTRGTGHSTRPASHTRHPSRDEIVSINIRGVREDLSSSYEYTRENALFTLMEYPGEARPLLLVINGLVTGDPAARVRAAAVECIAATAEEPTDYIPAFTAALGDEEMTVRVAAAEALGRMGPAAAVAVPDLERALVNGWWYGPQAAANALKCIDAEHLLGLIPRYLECLGSDNPDDRIAAAHALGCIGPYPQAPASVNADPDLAECPLGRSPGGLNIRLLDNGLEDVERISGDLDPRVAGVVDALLQAYAVENNPQARWMYLRAMGRFQHHAARANDILVDALDSDDKFIREAAACALAELGPTDKRAVVALTNALDDPEEAVVIDALRALRERGPAAAEALPRVPQLIRCNDEGDLQENVGMFIGSLGPNAASLVPTLIEALDNGVPWTAAIYAQTLGEIGPAATDALPALSHQHLSGAEAALVSARSLALIDPSGRQSGPLLLKGVDSPETGTRSGSATGLALIDPSPKYTQALIGLLADESNQTVAAAAHGLSTRGTKPGVIPALAGVLAADRVAVSFQAGLALIQTGEVHPDLVPAILDELAQRGLLADHRGGLVAGWLSTDDDQAVAWLIPALNLHNEGCWPANAALGLAERGPAALPAVPDLERLLDDPDAEVRLAAACSLARIAPDTLAGHLEVVERLIYRGAGPGRDEPCWILGELGPLARPALPALTACLHDGDAEVRDRAALAIAKIRGE